MPRVDCAVGTALRCVQLCPIGGELRCVHLVQQYIVYSCVQLCTVGAMLSTATSLVSSCLRVAAGRVGRQVRALRQAAQQGARVHGLGERGRRWVALCVQRVASAGATKDETHLR